MFRPHMVASFIALGWAAQRARHVWQGLLVTALLVVTSVGYFGGRLRKVSTTIARVAVPTVAWIGTQMVLFGGYSLGALFLVNNYFGSAWRRDGRWEYWYFETFVQSDRE